MSMDFWLQSFDKREQGFFPLTLLEQAFAKAIVNKHTYCEIDNERSIVTFTLQYLGEEDFNLQIIATNEASPLISGFGFTHPPANNDFWQSLIDILKTTTTALYWAAPHNALVIGQPDTRHLLPPDMIETLGEPRIVISIKDMFIS